MKKTGSPLRQAINKHLYRRHDGFIGHGSTDNRLIMHEQLHAQTDCDHWHPVADDPSIVEEGTREG